MARPHKCPFCGDSTSVGKGYRRTKTMGKRRIRLCKACGRKFTPKNQQMKDEETTVQQPEQGREENALAPEAPPPWQPKETC